MFEAQSVKDAKANARILKDFLSKHGVIVNHGLALETISRLARHKTWAQFLLSAKESENFLPLKAAVEDWPQFVFALKNAEDALDETWHALPAHATLDSRWVRAYRSIHDDDAVEVQELLLSAPGSHIVVKEFYSRVPSVDKYSLPWYADDDGANVAREVRKNFGFAAISPDDGGVEADFRQTGDDSSPLLWMVAYVEPGLAAKLAKKIILDSEFSVDDQGYRQVLEQYFGLDALDWDLSIVFSTLQDPRHSEKPARALLEIVLDSGPVEYAKHVQALLNVYFEAVVPSESLSVKQLAELINTATASRCKQLREALAQD